jgi:hypothetical protein
VGHTLIIQNATSGEAKTTETDGLTVLAARSLR